MRHHADDDQEWGDKMNRKKQHAGGFIQSLNNHTFVSRDRFARYFREHLTDDRFPLQSCRDCGNLQHYPRIICSKCKSDNLEFRDHDGRGLIVSLTMLPQANPEDGGQVTCVVGLVRLLGVETNYILTHLVASDQAKLEIGAHVVLKRKTQREGGLHEFEVV